MIRTGMTRWAQVWLALAGVLLVLFTGCKKKSGTESGEGTFTMNGASEVVGALDRKEYETAVRSLSRVKASLTEKDRDEYSRLLQKVKDTIVESMGTNQSAAQAYQILRFMETGR